MIDDPSFPSREQGATAAAVQRQDLFHSGSGAEKGGDGRRRASCASSSFIRIRKKELQAILSKYRNIGEVGWVQEEPKNRGAWTFMSDRLEPMLPETAVLNYFGRDESASPAVGSKKINDQEEGEIISRALDLRPVAVTPS